MKQSSHQVKQDHVLARDLTIMLAMVAGFVA